MSLIILSLIIIQLGSIQTGKGESTPQTNQQTRSFVVALTVRPRSLDPGYIQLLPDIQLMDANLEQFWMFDDSNDQYNEVKLLGLDFIQVDNFTIDIPLRQGVKFHDMTDFNASVAKWNIDRFFFKLPRIPGTEPGIVDADLIESLLPDLDLSWVPTSPDPDAVIKRPVCILNSTQVIETYKIRLILNIPLGAILYASLRGAALKMISPTAHAAYETQQIPMNKTVIGTGPFKMIGYDEIGLQARYEAFDEYWRGRPKIDFLTYVAYEDEDARDTAIFSGAVDFTYGMRYSNLESAELNPDLTVLQAGVSPGTLAFSLNCLPGHVDLPLRKALSYSFPYDYIIDETLGGQAERYGRPIPLGKQWDNKSLPYPTENLTYARQILIDAGKVPSFNSSWTDNDWIALAESGSAVANLKMPVLTGSNTEWIRIVVPEAWKKIGVNIQTWPMTYEEFYPGQQVYNKTGNDILYQDWANMDPDPTGFLNSWYGENETYNFANYYDPDLQNLLHDMYLAKTPEEKGATIYAAQDLIAERSFAYINVAQLKQFNIYYSSRWTNVSAHFLQQGDFYYVVHVGDLTSGTTTTTGSGDINIPGFPLIFLLGAIMVPIIIFFLKKRCDLKNPF